MMAAKEVLIPAVVPETTPEPVDTSIFALAERLVREKNGGWATESEIQARYRELLDAREWLEGCGFTFTH